MLGKFKTTGTMERLLTSLKHTGNLWEWIIIISISNNYVLLLLLWTLNLSVIPDL